MILRIFEATAITEEGVLLQKARGFGRECYEFSETDPRIGILILERPKYVTQNEERDTVRSFLIFSEASVASYPSQLEGKGDD